MPDTQFEMPIYLEESREGRRTILELLGWSRSKFFTNLKMLKEEKVVFYSKEAGSVRPRIKSYPSWIKAFQREKGLI